jgi:hypothetical protein
MTQSEARTPDLSDAQQLLFNKCWTAALSGHEQTMCLEAWSTEEGVEFCFFVYPGEKVYRWTFTVAGDETRQFRLVAPMTITLCFANWRANDCQVTFDLAIRLHAFTTLTVANERIGITLADPDERRALGRLRVDTIRELQDLLTLWTNSVSHYDEDFPETETEVLLKRKCWTRRNCDGRVIGKFVHCHNCRNASGKSLGMFRNDPNCENC